MNPSLEMVLDRLDGVKKAGSGYTAHCPAHEDNHQSLSVGVGRDGQILLKCHAGCSIQYVVGALGLELRDLWIPSSDAAPRTPQAQGPTLAPIELRHKVYSDLLDLLSITTSHYQDLISRGLSPQDTRTYKSMGWYPYVKGRLADKYLPKDLYDIPGFRSDGPVIQSGLLIPIRDHIGRIQGLQVMTGGTPKYVWFSGGGSPSVGSPIHHVNPDALSWNHVVVTEGPLKADVAYHLYKRMMPFMAVPGVNNTKHLFPALLESGAKGVTLAFDADWRTNKSVRKALKTLYTQLKDRQYVVRFWDWDIRDGKGIDDLLQGGKTPITYITDSDIEALLDEEQEVVRKASEIAPEPITWLWPNWIPLGALSILDGDPGLGKSTFTADMALRVTKGWGDYGPIEVGDVLFLTAEDSISQIVVPRLKAAGADLDRVHFLDGFTGEGGLVHQIQLPDHLDKLQRVIRNRSIKLVIIDPFFAYLSMDLDSHKDQHIRACLSGLKRVVEATGSAILLIRHLAKDDKKSSLYRGMGSIGIIASVRTGLLLTQHPDYPERKVLAVQKSNLGRFPKPLEYQITDADGIGVVEWLGTSDLSVKDVQKQANAQELKKQELAIKVIQDALSGEVKELDWPTLSDRLKQWGISDATGRRVRSKMGLVYVRIGKGSDHESLWRLPEGGSNGGEEATTEGG